MSDVARLGNSIRLDALSWCLGEDGNRHLEERESSLLPLGNLTQDDGSSASGSQRKVTDQSMAWRPSLFFKAGMAHQGKIGE